MFLYSSACRPAHACNELRALTLRTIVCGRECASFEHCCIVQAAQPTCRDTTTCNTVWLNGFLALKYYLTHTHSHTHTHKHTHSHTHTNTHTYLHTHTQTQTRKHTYTPGESRIHVKTRWRPRWLCEAAPSYHCSH